METKIREIHNWIAFFLTITTLCPTKCCLWGRFWTHWCIQNWIYLKCAGKGHNGKKIREMHLNSTSIFPSVCQKSCILTIYSKALCWYHHPFHVTGLCKADMRRWKLESLHRQRGLAFLESNATFRLESDSSAWMGRLAKPSFDCNLEKERAEDWTQRWRMKGGSWIKGEMSCFKRRKLSPEASINYQIQTIEGTFIRNLHVL